MTDPQDKSDQDEGPAHPRSRVTPSIRDGERIQIMEDGTDMSLTERLSYALNLVPSAEWQSRFGRSAKQLHRYLDGADVPFSVMTMIAAMTGVPVDWLASGRPTYGRSGHDGWRESLAPEGVSAFPGSLRQRTPMEMVQVAEKTDGLTLEKARTIGFADFRVQTEKSELAERSERLRKAVRDAGGNKTVSAVAGVPASTLSDYLSGSDWKFSSAISLARACHVSLDWLAGFRDASPPKPADINFITAGSIHVAEAKNYAIIPKYDIRASAGAGNEVVDESYTGSVALEETFFRENLGANRTDIVTIRAEGDSMDPTIRDGDLLFVDTSVHEVQNSRIYVLNVNDRLLVKRVQLRMDGSVLIKSDNPRYDPEVINPSEHTPLRIIGRVVYQAGPVRS